jgi:hypothetical protein
MTMTSDDSRTIITLLLRIGLIRLRADGSIRWPIHVKPTHWWLFLLVHGGHHPFRRFGVFRNQPGFVKWLPGRLLPRRWGFYVLGLEIGDRG